MLEIPARAAPEIVRQRFRLSGSTLLAAVLAVALGWFAYDDGGYGIAARSSLAIGVWWTIVAAVGLGLWPLARPTRAAVSVALLLAGFGVMTLASAAWAADSDGAFQEFDRVALYLGVFVLTVIASTRASRGMLVVGLAVALSFVGVIALASRLFVGLFSTRGLPEFLPGASTRLSFPVGYWNGLGFLVALALPLLLHLATVPRRDVLPGLALVPVPALACVVYLTSSRGAVATAVAGAATYLILTPRRLSALSVLAVGGAGSVLALGVLRHRSELVDGPFQGSQAVHDGRMAALLILVVCIGTGAVYAAGALYAPRGFPYGAATGRALVLALGLLAVVAVALAHPVARFDTFKAVPGTIPGAANGFAQAHLLSGNGSGRWQFWQAAVSEWRTSPLYGRGAGSYEAWWAQHGTIPAFVQDAHSQYLQTLGELGAVGLALLVGALLVGLGAGVRAVFRAPGPERAGAAALAALFVGYVVAAGIDWMWQLSIVTVVAMLALGLLVGPASASGSSVALAPRPRRLKTAKLFPLIALVVVGWAVVCVEVVPFAAAVELGRSATAAAGGKTEEALRAAQQARSIEPWSSQPYLQTALILEAANRLQAARQSAMAALERDTSDWRLWLVNARLETKLGHIRVARRLLLHAAALDPRSPLFASVVRGGAGTVP